MHIRWRGLELPSVVHCDTSTLTGTYGKFIAEPFERGFGATIGNSLRRIMLSSLEGSAVTQIKIRGAQHEFTSVPGVIEDVTEIVLNVKSLVVKKYTTETRVIAIDKKAAGPVTGADVQCDSDIEVINKDHVIANISADRESPLFVEMVVENGRGYVPSTEHSAAEHEVGVIPIDAVFSPITRVRYEVEETRVGQKTNYDKLTLEIWTNGSISPEMALVEASKILRKHLNPFVQYSELGAQVHSATRGTTGDLVLEAKLNMSIAELRLSVRANNCLESEGVNSVRQLVQLTDDQLLEFRNFGDTTLSEVKQRLSEHGLHLGMRVPVTR
jgi:DNA-directed RNA polymerase subunit alpha